ncbi:hypothetical protein BKE38_11365 [Pseudoroseomonas deserti]|uniref:Uncharacterized protein n=1 Tax=Teichococcus deserti TaxID=1817963 RepID=A0A1V2H3T8_9PROT|nr:hypothetical protein [Pseudoroseomonas deserti]ONG53808.1 hypothetical protein BKE38_11365 [Pseudoroseomonas deserti]
MAASRRPAATPAPGPAGTPAGAPALRRLAELAHKPVPPDRIRREVEGMVRQWREGAGEGGRMALREQLSDMQAELSAGVEAAQEQVDDLEREDLAGRRHATSAMLALQAARDAMAAAQVGL